MKAPPILAVCILAAGCASTQQTMQPPAGRVSIELAAPSGKIDKNAQACRQGPVIVILGCQIGITAKPVGLDILNPAASIAAQQNSGTSGSAATAGNVEQTKPSVLPADPVPGVVEKVAEVPDKVSTDTPEAEGDGDGPGQPAVSASQDEKPAAPSGGD